MKYKLWPPIIIALAAISLYAYAVPPGEKILYDDAPYGTAVFDGQVHKQQGLRCDSCHPAVFEERAGIAETTFADHHNEESCFACHEVSFENEGNCMSCHSMPAADQQ